jgi:diguanylate cyclase (GGDEF)-like protein/PAS domain S-box-containing protein
VTLHAPTNRNAPPDHLSAADAALAAILAAQLPAPISEEGCSAQVLPLVRSVNRLIGFVEELSAFVVPLAKGDLNAPLPSADNPLAVPFAELRSRLSEIASQASAIACDDEDQRIESMSDFSQAFNSMVALLAEREASLKTEIVSRKDAEEELQRERDLLVSGPVITLRWDIDDEGTVLYMSPNISTFGYRAEEFVSGRRKFVSIIHPEDYLWVIEDGNVKSQSGLNGWTQEYRVIDLDGNERWVRDYTHAVRDDEGSVVCYEGYIIDISAEKAAETALRRREQQLRMLSLTDELTGLYNRRGLFALGEHMMRSAHRRKSGLGVVFVDLDGLKEINDRFGHRRGDDALCDVARVLKGCARESDVLARAGGDEFVALVEDISPAVDQIAKRVERRIIAQNAKGDRPYKLRASLGVVYWAPAEKVTLPELIERADRRMYEAKRSRRTR